MRRATCLSTACRLTRSAAQVFILPFALLLPVVAPAKVRRHLALHDKLPPFLYLTLLGASFLVGFALIGVPAVEYGLIIAVLRLPLEAVRLSLVKAHLKPDRVGGIFVTSALVSWPKQAASTPPNV